VQKRNVFKLKIYNYLRNHIVKMSETESEIDTTSSSVNTTKENAVATPINPKKPRVTYDYHIASEEVPFKYLRRIVSQSTMKFRTMKYYKHLKSHFKIRKW
jgi:hypothetical protein